MSKNVTKRSRGSGELENVPNVRKVAKTGAERIREYRARIMTLDNAAAAGSPTNVEGKGMAIQTASQQNLEDNQVDMCENQRSLLYEALNRQSRQDDPEAGDNHRQFFVQVDVHQPDLPLFSEAPSTSTMQMQSSTQKVTKLRRHSKSAKTPAERARAYRERKKALKNTTNQQLMINTTHSHVEVTVGLEEVSQEAINVGTSTARSRQCEARKRPYGHLVEPPPSPSTSGSSNNRMVESSVAASVYYKPTLWYYKHLNFLSGNKDPDSDDSDSDHNDDTVYVQLPRGQKRPATTSIAQEGESDTSIDASAAAFGRSVGAQLHHLSKMQRCIAEKLISDVIYHAKMEQLSLDTTIDVKEVADDHVNILIPKAGPSWYDTDTTLDTGGQESSSSCKLLNTTEDFVSKEIAETESAVNFIKMERDETENYCFQDDEDEQNHAIDIIKEELL